MPQFSERSLKNLAQCDERLQRVAHEAIKHFDFTVICGHRGEAEQNAAYKAGHSRLKFPQSKHNKTPSLAFDACPFPIDWNDHKRFQIMGKVMKEAAASLGIKITWGGDWHSFVDKPHFEVVE